MRAEVVTLSAELTERPSKEHLEIGVPDVDTAQAIVAALRETLWDYPPLNGTSGHTGAEHDRRVGCKPASS